MPKKINSEIQIIFVIVFAAIFLILLSVIIGGNSQLPIVSAQGPITPTVAFTPAPLEAFGLSADEMIMPNASASFDLQILKSTGVVSVTPGTVVTYTVTITNQGSNNAQYFYFYDSFPPQMQHITYTFPANVTAISNEAENDQDLQWLITTVLTGNHTINITITGELTSNREINVTNTAVVTPWIQADTNPSNNIAGADVLIAGEGLSPGKIFLPFVQKFPTPTPEPITLAYHEDFNSGSNWQEFTSNGCETDNDSDRFFVRVDRDERACLPPAKDESNPEKPYRTYGEFEVQAYDSGDERDSGTTYGLFINGEGGDDYYYFRIWPNTSDCSSGGDWQLRRRKDGDENTLISGDCNTAIKRGYGSASQNTLRVAHDNSRTLTVYVNGTELGSYTETSSNERRGTGTGLYVDPDNHDVLIKFDNFKVYKYP